VLPTAAGKTHVISTICKDAITRWNGRVLILAHVKELLQQAADKLQAVCPEVPVGIYSAGLGSRDTHTPVIIGGIQSVYRRANELGHFDLAIVDESHLIPTDGDGMYRTLLTDLKTINPILRVIGLTATPFRMTTGPICGPENVLNSICYEIGVRELIDQGFLCPLITKAGRTKVDTKDLHIRNGDYVASEVEQLMDDDALIHAACKEIVEHTLNRKSCLIFASGVKHGEHVADKLESMGQRVATIFGGTLPFVREQTIADFKAGKLKYLVNVNVLTIGFDAPNIDCVAMLRPTLSPGLYYQILGRGFRLHPGKENCLVLDFGGNALRHGPVDALRIQARPFSGGGNGGSAPAKECPQCQGVIAAGHTMCPYCGYEFDPPPVKHDAKPSNACVLSGKYTDRTYDVQNMRYHVHTKRDASPDTPRTLRVEYGIGWHQYRSEWVCLEHKGYARLKAEQWWAKRSKMPVPETVEEAVRLAEGGALCKTKSITTRLKENDRYEQIIGHDLGEVPDGPGIDRCPECGSTDRKPVDSTGPDAARVICAQCGCWLQWSFLDELDNTSIPFDEHEPACVPAGDSIPF
jgi:DNA repair protein RadD